MIDNCVIVEPRITKNLLTVIENVIFSIPQVKITIFHGNNNQDFIIDNFKSNLNRLRLINLNQDNISIQEYNNYLTSVNFWNKIEGENILIFQTDSIICNYNEKFINICNNYGFVGAPIKKWDIPWQNGGLSLRKKSLMIKAIEDKKDNESFWPEDRYFTMIKTNIVNPAPFFIANKFSVEKFYYHKPFGIHKCWKYLPVDELNSLIQLNSNILKLER